MSALGVKRLKATLKPNHIQLNVRTRLTLKLAVTLTTQFVWELADISLVNLLNQLNRRAVMLLFI